MSKHASHVMSHLMLRPFKVLRHQAVKWNLYHNVVITSITHLS